MQNQNKSHKFDPAKSEHNIRVKIIKTGIWSFVIAILVFFGILLFYPLTTRLPANVLISKLIETANWNFVSGIAAAITVSLVIGGLVFVFLEHSRNTIQAEVQFAAAEFNIYKEIFDRLMSKEDIIARRWIIINIPTLNQMGNDPIVWLEKVKEIINSSPKVDDNRSAGWERIC